MSIVANQVVALLVQTGGQILSDQLKLRYQRNQLSAEDSMAAFLRRSEERMRPYTEPRHQQIPVEIEPEYIVHPETVVVPYPTDIVPAGQAEAIPTGCVPCSLGHFNTCQGVLNESVRFAHQGLGSKDVVDRVSACLGELNALERLDLRPEMLEQLDGLDRELAEKALQISRATRHQLEGMRSVDDLIGAAATMQTSQKSIARQWFGNKLRDLTPEDQEEISRRLEAKLLELEEGEYNAN